MHCSLRGCQPRQGWSVGHQDGWLECRSVGAGGGGDGRRRFGRRECRERCGGQVEPRLVGWFVCRGASVGRAGGRYCWLGSRTLSRTWSRTLSWPVSGIHDRVDSCSHAGGWHLTKTKIETFNAL